MPQQSKAFIAEVEEDEPDQAERPRVEAVEFEQAANKSLWSAGAPEPRDRSLGQDGLYPPDMVKGGVDPGTIPPTPAVEPIGVSVSREKQVPTTTASE